MKKPRFILFDYGHTLGYEKGFDALAGAEAMLKCSCANPRSVTAAQLARHNDGMFAHFAKNAHSHNIEVPRSALILSACDLLGLEFDLPLCELETLFWDAACPAEPMPGAALLLDYLDRKGIPTGVVSNISFTSETVIRRLERLFPQNRLRFVTASSEYGIRKPDRIIFDIAAAKTGFLPEEIWFCGDNPTADILGAQRAGMVPVWCRSAVKCYYRPDAEAAPEGEYITVSELSELIPIIEGLE